MPGPPLPPDLVTDAGEDQLRGVVGVPDPGERVRAITAKLQSTQAVLAWLAEHRREALRELRAAGLSYTDVAQLLGVTKARAQQLCHDLPRGGTQPPGRRGPSSAEGTPPGPGRADGRAGGSTSPPTGVG